MLGMAKARLRLNELDPPTQRRVTLVQGSVLNKGDRLKGFDAIALVEVIEHLQQSDLPTLEQTVFGFANPNTVVITTPNIEYNLKLQGVIGSRFRSDEHKFEWTRTESQSWAHRVVSLYPYLVGFEPIGGEDSQLGSPTQMAIFTRRSRY